MKDYSLGADKVGQNLIVINGNLVPVQKGFQAVKIFHNNKSKA